MSIQIALFKNDRKTHENQPDYKGWNKETGDSVAGWIKHASNGTSYISLKFETGEERKQYTKEPKQSQPPRQSPAFQTDPSDDDIPF